MISNVRSTAVVFSQLPVAWNTTLGLVFQPPSRTLYYVTVDTIFSSKGGTSAQLTLYMQFGNIEISPDAVVAGDGGNLIYIVDGTVLYTVNLASKTIATQPLPDLSFVIDVQWWECLLPALVTSLPRFTGSVSWLVCLQVGRPRSDCG